MTRRTKLTAGGLAIMLVLGIAGGLALVGYTFANDNVQTQLAGQKIFFPEKGSDAMKDARIGPYLTKYAGQQLVTGAQAEAYANHYIGVHIKDVGKGTPYAGKTYAELGPLVRANPEDTKLAAARETVFKGETLRGLLLNAFAWWKMGQIALWGSIVAFALAGVSALLSAVAFWRGRRVAVPEEIRVPRFEAARVAS